MKKISLIFLLIFFGHIALAEDLSNTTNEISTLQIGNYKVEYNAKEKKENETIYILNDVVLMSSYDENTDNKDDLWIAYDDDYNIMFEAQAIDGGKANVFRKFDSDGNVIKEDKPTYTSKNVVLPQKPKTINYDNTQEKNNTSNKSINKKFVLNPPPKSDYGGGLKIKYIFYGIIIAVSSYLLYKKKKN